MDEKMDYRIGLDIGIASVGWAVLQNNRLLLFDTHMA